MDVSLLKELIGKGKPVRIETASGESYVIRHRDYVAFSPKRTSLLVLFEQDGDEHFALLPLLTVTAAAVEA
jgi:hypothetical protein